jgi:hypothetical protein
MGFFSKIGKSIKHGFNKSTKSVSHGFKSTFKSVIKPTFNKAIKPAAKQGFKMFKTHAETLQKIETSVGTAAEGLAKTISSPLMPIYILGGGAIALSFLNK